MVIYIDSAEIILVLIINSLLTCFETPYFMLYIYYGIIILISLKLPMLFQHIKIPLHKKLKILNFLIKKCFNENITI